MAKQKIDPCEPMVVENKPQQPSLSFAGTDECTADVDQLIDYNDKKDPFKNIPRDPPQSAKDINDRILIYYNRGDIWAKYSDERGLPCTWNEYLACLNNPRYDNMLTVSFPGNISLPQNGHYYAHPHGRYNYGNITYGSIARRYGSSSSGSWNFAHMGSVTSGVALVLDYHFTYGDGWNLCQINNRYQGYVDATCKIDPIGYPVLRLRWVKEHCFGDFSPIRQLNLKDKGTLFSLAWYTMQIETGTQVTLSDLENALTLCKSKNSNMSAIS